MCVRRSASFRIFRVFAFEIGLKINANENPFKVVNVILKINLKKKHSEDTGIMAK